MSEWKMIQSLVLRQVLIEGMTSRLVGFGERSEWVWGARKVRSCGPPPQ